MSSATRRNDGSTSKGPKEATPQSEGGGMSKEKEVKKTFMDRWVEPSLAAPKASYQDHGGAPYGVLDGMQPLGEAPSAKVKTRLKDTRKSVLGRSSAAVSLDAPETPEGSPAPAPPTPQAPIEPPVQQPIVIDDERDTDYAPNTNGKKKERTMRSRAVTRKNESASSATPTATSSKPETTSTPSSTKFEYDGAKLKRVVDAAKARAVEVGKPDLAAAVNEIYEQSLSDVKLRILLESILTQEATSAQNTEFQDYVRAAKKKLKAAKNQARQQPAHKTNGSQAVPIVPPSPPARLTLQPTTTNRPEASSAIPSTEHPEPLKPRISLKLNKSPAKDPNRRRAGKGNMSTSPKKRSGSVGSDSSLTSLTSNEDNNGIDLDEAGELNKDLPGPSTKVNGKKGKDHAAERGSLAVPGGAVKRLSTEAELEEDRDRAFAAKKQRLTETVARDYDYSFSESHIRPSMAAPRSRAHKIKRQSALPASLQLEPHGSRATSTRGSRAPSMDVDSPLSELSPENSRQSTPKGSKPAPRAFGKRAKTKQSPEKKQLAAFSGMSGVGGAGRESPIGDDDNEELGSENNDFCEACHGSGYLLCCDGCDRSFHFTCLDPPLNDNAKELDEPWFCYICVAKRPAGESPEKPSLGMFAPLMSSLKKRNPSNFALPDGIRDYFEGVATDVNGSFVEALTAPKPTRSRPGYSDEQPDYYKMRDSKSNLVLCYSCGQTSQNGTPHKRPIVTCDHCGQHWHLDCLDPPLANPPALNQNGKKVHDWMCPLHADQELRRVDTSLLSRRRIHIRKPKNAQIQETALTRGFRNNGIIEVGENDTDDDESEFYEQENGEGSVVYKLPAQGIKLDFIEKVKCTRVQRLRDEREHKRARITTPALSALEQANFAKRPFNEQQLALNLAQFASDNNDLDLGRDQVENLVGALIAEAPSAVVDEMMAADDAEKAKPASSVVPPSPPSSEQTDPLPAEQRKELLMLQELIRRKLESSKT